MEKDNAIIADKLYRSTIEMKISDFKSYVNALGWECYESPREESLIVELLLSKYARDEKEVYYHQRKARLSFPTNLGYVYPTSEEIKTIQILGELRSNIDELAFDFARDELLLKTPKLVAKEGDIE